MNHDPGSGTGISYDAQFTLVMIQVDASRKTADQPFLNDMSGISPKTISHSENTPPRIYKKIFPGTQNSIFLPPCKVPESVGLHRFSARPARNKP